TNVLCNQTPLRTPRARDTKTHWQRVHSKKLQYHLEIFQNRQLQELASSDNDPKSDTNNDNFNSKTRIIQYRLWKKIELDLIKIIKIISEFN
ncbi:9102_t:CDS:2, partial [Racocetra persica]